MWGTGPKDVSQPQDQCPSLQACDVFFPLPGTGYTCLPEGVERAALGSGQVWDWTCNISSRRREAAHLGFEVVTPLAVPLGIERIEAPILSGGAVGGGRLA